MSLNNRGRVISTTILGKAKELPKERDAASPLALFEEKAEKKTSFTQVFLLPAPLLVKGLFFQGGILAGRPTMLGFWIH